MLGKAKDMYNMQKKAKRIKKELKNTHIEAEVDDVIIVIDGEQAVISVSLPGDNKKLENTLVKCLNKGIKKSQQVAAEEMKDLMGNMNIPGLT